MSWYPKISTGQLSFFKHIPKVELHRHLEGSLRLDTLREVAEAYDIPLPGEAFRNLVQIQHGETLNFTNFLSKFSILRQFYRSPEVIQRITREAIEDAAADNVAYLELRFTPVALTRLQGFSLVEAMDWVTRTTEEASNQNGIETRLIVSINRHEPVELAESVAQLAVDYLAPHMNGGVVAIDLAGSEADHPAAPFAGIFREAVQSGLRVTLHAGEWGPAWHIRQAIEEFGAERVGHGVRILDDPAVVALARERGTIFEVCVTSNYHSGVISALTDHPLACMINNDLKLTINTDDPGISGITLSDEYRILLEPLGISQPALKNCILDAAQAAFLPKKETNQLVQTLKARLDQILE